MGSVADTKWYKGQDWTPRSTLKKAVAACLTYHEPWNAFYKDKFDSSLFIP